MKIVMVFVSLSSSAAKTPFYAINMSNIRRFSNRFVCMKNPHNRNIDSGAASLYLLGRYLRARARRGALPRYGVGRANLKKTPEGE
jgi:hypothetical protein